MRGARLMTGLLIAGLLLAPALGRAASPAPGASVPPAPWMTADELRRELEGIRFVFRYDATLGWRGRAPVDEFETIYEEAPGDRPASPQVVIYGDDTGLTALMEVATSLRVPSDTMAIVLDAIRYESGCAVLPGGAGGAVMVRVADSAVSWDEVTFLPGGAPPEDAAACSADPLTLPALATPGPTATPYQADSGG